MLGLTIPRLLRHMAATGAGLPADDALVFDAVEQELKAACSALGRGEAEPARRLLAATRETRDWKRRSSCVWELAERALHNPEWLDRWHEQRPDDPDMALVRAALAVERAWAVRTGARARDVTAEQFQAFRALLDDALPVIDTAIALNPGDPVPWAVSVQQGVGAAAPRHVFEERLARALACDPHNLSAHSVAVQYLAKKWYGSHEEMLAFAERAAADAPDGHPLRGLPVMALAELLTDDELAREGRRKKYGPIAVERVAAAIDAALQLSAAYPADEPRLAQVRNHLAWAMIRDGRPPADILEVFRSIGRGATSRPWSYLGGDPAAQFRHFRRGVRGQVARATPFFGAVPTPTPVSDAVNDPLAAGPRCEVALVPASVAAVTEAVLLTGTSYRMQRTTGRGTCTLVETAPSQDPSSSRSRKKRGPGLRATLLGEGDLVRLAASFSYQQPWPVLVVSQVGDEYSLTLLRNKKTLAQHFWSGPENVPPLEQATAVAQALIEAFGVHDPRPLSMLLRDPGDDGRALAAAVLNALGLPGLPAGFGDRPEVLADLPGVSVVRKRSLLAAMRESLKDSEDSDTTLSL